MNIMQKLFQDNTGKYIIAQPPNVPVYIILLAWLAKSVITSGAGHDLAAFIMHAAVFLWAYLEIMYGESPFRRTLGVTVMLGLLYSVVFRPGP